jgi:Ras-related protein Rab-1A
LLLRFTDATFSEDSVNTLGTEFKEKELATDDWKAKFQVWDTAGQEKFRTITSSYYRGAQGVLIVFDVAKRETWEHVAKWLEQVDKYSSEGIQKVIVANKTDLEVEVDLDEVKVRKRDCSAKCAFLTSCNRSPSQLIKGLITLKRPQNRVKMWKRCSNRSEH